MKRVLTLTLVMAVLISGVAAGLQAADRVYEIAVAVVTNAGTNEEATLLRFKELLEKRSGGRFVVNVYIGGVLGSENENIEQVKTNEIQLSLFGDLLTSQLCPELDPTVIPFIYRKVDDVYAFWEGETGEMLNKVLIERGNQRVICLQSRGPRMLTASKKVQKPEDLQGLKLRIPEIASWMTVWASFGAIPTPVAWPEVYTALQTGVVDGAEPTIDLANSSALYEVNKYMTLTKHIFNVWHWSMNNSFYLGLPDDLRAILDETAQECCDWGNERLDANDARLLEEMKAKGLEVLEIDYDAFSAVAKSGIAKVGTGMNPAIWADVEKYMAD